jgi:hypothetical protein
MRLWLFSVGAGLGAIVGLTGCIASSEADWLGRSRCVGFYWWHSH